MADRRSKRALAGLALLSGALVYVIATVVYPHHSPNHDEAVYLQQAQLLLAGKLWLTAEIPELVRPWFFVQDGPRLYPKYTPVAAAVFAPGLAVGVPRLSLAVVAVANVALVGLVTADAFDDRTGVVAAALLVASPLFLLNSAVFLSYAPATAFNLAFALGYIRAWRADDATRRRRYAALAGLAVGLAFFARPFTAVLFAAPFVVHAGAALAGSWWRTSTAPVSWLGIDRAVLERTGIVAGLGIAFVGVTIAYNHVVTGEALLFPYEAFAPADGPGFGHREIVGHERAYTPILALEANARVLWTFGTDWTAAAPLGTLLSGIGLGAFVVRARRHLEASLPRPDRLTDIGVRTLLVGVLVSVVVGNVFFWGNLNLLGGLDDPGDGLISILGPFYHLDLLLPLSAFGAAGLVATGRRLRAALRDRLSPGRTRLVLTIVVLALLTVGGVAQAAALGDPIERSQPYTDRYDRAYEPFEETTFENALVFVPTPYGDWLNHPFQSLRNDPDLGGAAVYVQDRNASADFRALSAYPARTPYRYTYRGAWTASLEEEESAVEPALKELSVRSGGAHRIHLEVGRVLGSQSARVRIESGGESVTYAAETLRNDTLAVDWLVEPGQVRVVEDGFVRYSDRDAVGLSGPSEVSLTVTFTQPGGSTVTYRQEVAVRSDRERASVVWPPETSVCRLVTDCGYEGTYVEGAEGYPSGTSVTQTIETRNRTAAREN